MEREVPSYMVVCKGRAQQCATALARAQQRRQTCNVFTRYAGAPMGRRAGSDGCF